MGVIVGGLSGQAVACQEILEHEAVEAADPSELPEVKLKERKAHGTEEVRRRALAVRLDLVRAAFGIELLHAWRMPCREPRWDTTRF